MQLSLPGPAAAVQAVPALSQLVGWLEQAGFVDLHCEKLGDSPCFTVSGIEMRETKLRAFAPLAASGQKRAVLYKGPFKQLQDDQGRTYRRAEPTAVDEATWQRLRASAAADQFVFEFGSTAD